MNRRLAAALLPLALPWTVVVAGPTFDLVFAWGLVSSDPLHVTPINAYLFEFTAGLPDRLLAWPTSAALYALGVAGVLAGAAGREDRRVTAGLFLLAGAAHLSFALGVGRPRPVVAAPLGTAVLWALAYRNRPRSWVPAERL